MSPRPPIDRRRRHTVKAEGCFATAVVAVGVIVVAVVNLAVLALIVAVIVWTLRALGVLA